MWLHLAIITLLKPLYYLHYISIILWLIINTIMILSFTINTFTFAIIIHTNIFLTIYAKKTAIEQSTQNLFHYGQMRCVIFMALTLRSRQKICYCFARTQCPNAILFLSTRREGCNAPHHPLSYAYANRHI